MLVLRREINEIVVIEYADGTTMALAVISIDRGRVRLGFEAPPDVKIHRKEVYDAIQLEKRQAIDSPEAITQETDDPEHPDFGKDYA